MRRYIAQENYVSFDSPNSKYVINITIGTDTSCTDEEHIYSKICNGPLANGESYR